MGFNSGFKGLMVGQPSTAGNLETVVQIHELVATDHQNDTKFDGGSNAHELRNHSSNLSRRFGEKRRSIQCLSHIISQMSSFLSDSTTLPAKPQWGGYLLLYTPDLVPAIFFYCLKVKTAPKWRCFEDSHHINMNVTAESKAIPSNNFNDCFVQLLEIYI